MEIERINPNIKYVYHYTLKKNVEKILSDKSIKSKDPYVFFTQSLNDSITAFEREIMQEGKLYIDLDGVLRKREKCNKDDYCILKIPYINDNQFYKFNFPYQSKESIYTISISHKGNYNFKEAKILEFPRPHKINPLNKAVIAALATGMLLFPYNVFAASWLDNGNYDISWYSNEEATNYSITTAEQLAGLAHLVNNENKAFSGKIFNIEEDIDLTANTWEPIEDIFEGTLNGNICGSHRIILNYLDGKLVKNKDIDIVAYSYKVLENKTTTKNVVINNPYTVEKLKEVTGAQVVLLNDTKLNDIDPLLNLTENDKLEIVTGNYSFFIKNVNGIFTPFEFEAGDSIVFVRTKYSEETNIPTDKLVLKYNERELLDEKNLADYNITKYQIINAYVKVNINVSVVEGQGEITSTHNNALSGDNITISLNPDSKYELSKLTVNGIDKTNEVQNNKLSITCDEEDINVRVSYKLKAEEITNPNTSDNIITYIALFFTSLLGLLLCKFINKNKSKNIKL